MLIHGRGFSLLIWNDVQNENIDEKKPESTANGPYLIGWINPSGQVAGGHKHNQANDQGEYQHSCFEFVFNFKHFTPQYEYQ